MNAILGDREWALRKGTRDPEEHFQNKVPPEVPFEKKFAETDTKDCWRVTTTSIVI